MNIKNIMQFGIKHLSRSKRVLVDKPFNLVAVCTPWSMKTDEKRECSGTFDVHHNSMKCFLKM